MMFKNTTMVRISHYLEAVTLQTAGMIILYKHQVVISRDKKKQISRV